MKPELFQKFPVYPGNALTKTLLVMKLTIFLFFLGCLHAGASGYSQTVSLSENGAPLTVIFKKIEQQTGYSFAFNNAWMAQTKPVTISVKDMSIKDVLDICFRDQPFTYTIVEKIIVVKEISFLIKQPELSISLSNLIDIHGQVTDSLGVPLSGASINIKGSKRGTSTDEIGNFYLKNIAEDAILVVSFTGFGKKEYRVSRNSSFAIVLSRSNSRLDEIQVIGYGTTTARLSTGNVQSVKSSDLEKQPVSNPLLALEGRVPGLIVTQGTGVPGGQIKVQIRGKNSINQSNDPLYIIDGVPYTSQLLGNPQFDQQGLVGPTGILGGGINPFNFINPSDIESIDILKDADATAIYGSKGSNGVILITTKKGKAGAIKVNVNAQSGQGQITRKAKLMNTKQYLDMRNEAFMNDGVTPSSTDLDVNGTWSNTKFTDWQKMFIGGTAHFTNIQASISGGNINTQYLIGGGYNKETTVFPGDWGDQKASLHFNINSASKNQKFKIGLTGSFLEDNNMLPTTDLTKYILLPPNAPSLYNADKSLNWTDFGDNPLAYNLYTYHATTTNLIGNGVLSYSIIPGLEAKINLGYTNLNLNERTAIPTTFWNPSYGVTTGSSAFNTNIVKSWIIEPQLNYQATLGKGKLKALVGATIEQRQTDGQIVDGAGYDNDALLGNLAGAASISNGGSIFERYKYNSLLSRISYNWQDTYLINITGRRDGSSRFGPRKHFGNFGAVGVSWIFSNSNFIKTNIPILSFGKIRTSYGTSGNEPSSNYKYLELYNFINSGAISPYQGGTGLYPNNLLSPNYSWELDKKMEEGIELGFLRDRLLFSVSHFQNRTSNQLINYNLPSISGFQVITANLPATIQNYGWEFSANTVNVKTNKFNWTSIFNLSAIRNKLVTFPNIQNTTYNNTYTVGHSINDVKLFRFASVDPNTGLYQFFDKTGKITSNPVDPVDKVGGLVNFTPKFYGGLENNFRYENFELSFFLQFVKQTGANYEFSNVYSTGTFGSYNNQPQQLAERWQKSGDVSSYQKYSQDFGDAYNSYTYAQQSNIAFSDASFIRVKNVSISYQLPQSFRNKTHFSSARIYLLAQNLFTVTNFNGVDPENQSIIALPPLRMITMGLQIWL